MAEVPSAHQVCVSFEEASEIIKIVKAVPTHTALDGSEGKRLEQRATGRSYVWKYDSSV